MSALDTLTRRIFELHKGSMDSIAELQGFNNNISTVNRAIARIYAAAINAVNAIAKAMATFGQMQGLFITGFARDLMPTLPPLLDTWNTEIEGAVAAGLEPLKLSIFWRLAPPTDAITRAMRELSGESRKMGITAYEPLSDIPPILPVSPPPVQQLTRAVNDYVGRTSEIEFKFFEAAHATALRTGINYGEARRRATRGALDVVRRGEKEAYGAEALVTTPPRLEAAETIREISNKIVAPAFVSAYPVTRASRYVVGVSEVGRIAQPLAKGISETYKARVLETVSKVRRLFIPAGVQIGRALGMAEVGGLVQTIPDMERGLQPITTGRVSAYRTGPASIGPTAEFVPERAAKAPIEVIVRYTDSLKNIGLRSHETARAVAGGRVIRPSPMERRLFDTFLDVDKRNMDRASREVFEIYRRGAPVAWTPSIRGAAKIVSDHLGRTSVMALKGSETYRLGVSRAPLVTEAVPSISEFTGRLPSLRIPVAEKTAENKQVLAVPEVGRLSQLIAEMVTEAYGLGVSRGPSVMKTMEAATSAPSISEFTGEAPSLRIPIAESKPILAVPNAEKSFRSIAQSVARTYRTRILNYIPGPVKGIADRVRKVSGFGGRKRAPDHGLDLVGVKQKELSVQTPRAVHRPSPSAIEEVDNIPVATVPETDRVFHTSGVILKELVAKTARFGIVEAKQPYVAVESMEAVRSLSGAIPRVSGRFSGMMGEKYLEMAESFAVGNGLGISPEMDHGINLMRGLSMAALNIARPSSTQKIVNVIKNHAIAMPDMSRAMATSSMLSKNFTDQKLEMKKAFNSYVRGMLVSLPRAPVGNQNLERIPLEAPVNVPSVKLQEIIPILSSIQPPVKRETPRANRHIRPVAQPRPITVNVEPLKGETDLRELRRKIAQILREEARRHGVI
jgi:hypothetical protein